MPTAQFETNGKRNYLLLQPEKESHISPNQVYATNQQR